jgi:hypothetical protein
MRREDVARYHCGGGQRERSPMETVKAALRGVGRLVRKARDLVSGDDLRDAQRHRGGGEEHRANPWPR